MNKSTISNFDAWPYEAQDEIQRVATEKKLGWIMENFFIFFAFSAARKCEKEYIKAMNVGADIPCTCGYHPSRRSLKMFITEELAACDLRIIADKFCVAGMDNETTRSAKILLEVLDTACEQLKEPKLLRERYIESVIRSEVLPVLALDVIKYFCAGKINARQADNALIEIKGRYQTVFAEMGINLTSAQAKKK